MAGVQEGDLLAGKYKVERVLGAGGMGVVVAAHHVQLEEKVALKFLLPQALSNPEAVARFLREARAAVRIKSEHVARVSDVGTLPNGAPYMVMEYLDGGDLAAWLRERGPLPVEQAVDFLLQACVAIAEAHSLGIVHRDLKPANLFCVRRADGQLTIKVLDFGISKLTDAARGSEPPAVSMTRTSAFMGSPLYMSPEQMSSAKSANAQSDIWALGVILYELLAGRVPFLGEVVTEVVVEVTTKAPPPLRDFRPDVPPGIEAAIVKCLEKDRRNRFRNVAELALAVVDFAPKRARASVERITGTIQAAGLSASALDMPPSPPVPGTLVSGGTTPPVSHTTPQPPRTGTSRAVFAGVALAGLVAAGGGFLALRKPQAPASASLSVSAPTPSPTALPEAVLEPPTATPTPTVTVTATPTAVHTAAHAHASPLTAGAVSPTPAAHAPSPAPAPNPSCDPPYTLDEQGRKKFKPECFLNK